MGIARKLQMAFLAASLSIAAAPSAVSPAGHWSGKIDVNDGNGAMVSQPVTLNLEDKAGSVTGTIGREGENEAVPIRNIRFENSQLDFEATSGETTGPVKFHLTLAGDRMEGSMKGAVDTEDFTGTVTVTRQKN